MMGYLKIDLKVLWEVSELNILSLKANGYHLFLACYVPIIIYIFIFIYIYIYPLTLTLTLTPSKVLIKFKYVNKENFK